MKLAEWYCIIIEYKQDKGMVALDKTVVAKES